MDQSHSEGLRQIIRDGLPGRPASLSRVLVLGAGMAGLTAAWELQRAGHQVQVVEARNRVGGRVETLRSPFSSGLFAEAGAMRIPTRHALVLDYVERFGLRTEPFVMRNPAGWCLFHGKKLRLGDTSLVRPSIFGYRLGDPEHQHVDPLWDRTLAPYRRRVLAHGAEGWSFVSDRLQHLSLRDWLVQEGWSADAIEMLGLFAGFETLFYGAALEFVRESILGLKDETVFISDGMDRLPEAFLPRLRRRIRYGTAVTSLGQDPDGIWVRVKNLGGVETLRADYGVITLPFSVLRHLEWQQPVSRDKQRAIRNLHYEAAVKIFFEARRRFWEEDEGIYGGSSVTDLAIRSCYYPQHGRDTGRGVFVGSYCHGQDAHRWGALEDSERLRQALENVAELHPNAPLEIEGGASKVWMSDPYAAGAYAFFQAHQEQALHDAIVCPEGRYHFAGEHCSRSHRWIQGAVESGLIAARAIHGRVLAAPTDGLAQTGGPSV